MTQNIAYLFGAGATEAEISHQGKKGETLLQDLGNHIYKMSEKIQGKYWNLVREFSLQPQDQDIELLISLIESSAPSLNDISVELKQLYREYLIKRITEAGIAPNITSSLLRLHKEYGNDMGKSGEQILGMLTTNNDCMIEKAFCDDMTFAGLNCGVTFGSDEYPMSLEIPPILKLHGSFNWKVSDEQLQISDRYETEEDTEFSGWIPPSVFKKPNLDKPIFQEIWGKAKELLKECDVLRVIGSSLRTADLPLLSLIFTSQVEGIRTSKKTFTIELIVPEKEAIGNEEKQGIIQRLGFLTGFKRLSELDVFSPEPDRYKEDNPYYYWMTRKISDLQDKNPAVANDDLINNRLFGGG